MFCFLQILCQISIKVQPSSRKGLFLSSFYLDNFIEKGDHPKSFQSKASQSICVSASLRPWQHQNRWDRVVNGVYYFFMNLQMTIIKLKICVELDSFLSSFILDSLERKKILRGIEKVGKGRNLFAGSGYLTVLLV